MKPYELPIAELPLGSFIHGTDGALIAEASDFGGAFRVERLYNDACDVGIAIRSHKTGRVVRFVLTREETRDGDLLAWHFAPALTHDAAACSVARVVVFND